jgi:hypothetical protein
VKHYVAHAMPRTAVALSLLVSVSTLAQTSPGVTGPAAVAALPRAVESWTTPAPTRRVKVCATCNLQAAINSAVSGDELLLAPGATYTGNFVLPNKGAAQSWITIRTDAALPAGRMTPSKAAALRLATIKTTSNVAAIATAVGAHHWRIAGVNIGGTPTASNITGLIRFGDGGTAERTMALVAHHLILDRAFVHGEPTQDVRRCIALNSAETAILDSWISDCHSLNGDSQAIAGWNGPGPFLIRNNRLEGGHEIVLFGGADPTIPNLIPSDISLVGNHIIRPMAWRGVWQAKNLVETKNAVRFLVEGNVIENVWVDAQAGFAFVLKSENQTGGAPWTQTADVTIRYNVINNATEGFTITAKQGTHPAVNAARFTIHDNVIGAFLTGGDGKNVQLIGPVSDVNIFHNTFTSSTSTTITLGDDPTRPLVRASLHSNIFINSTYGVKGNSTPGGTPTITKWMPGGLWATNALVGANCAYYPAGTFCRLSAALPSGVDGRPIGADLALVQAATAGVVVAP